MDRYDQNDDYKWFTSNQKELFKKYPNKFLIISKKEIVGSFDSFDEAMEKALEAKKAGEFIIQQCVKNFEPIQYYNRAVSF